MSRSRQPQKIQLTFNGWLTPVGISSFRPRRYGRRTQIPDGFVSFLWILQWGLRGSGASASATSYHTRWCTYIANTMLSQTGFSPSPIGERSIVMSESVCLSIKSICVYWYVCLHAYLAPHVQSLPTNYAHINHGWGSVVLWRRCDTLCISVFVDDVTFSYYGANSGMSLPLTPLMHGISCVLF